jgi:uncharacterized membrane protein YgcG
LRKKEDKRFAKSLLLESLPRVLPSGREAAEAAVQPASSAPPEGADGCGAVASPEGLMPPPPGAVLRTPSKDSDLLFHSHLRAVQRWNSILTVWNASRKWRIRTKSSRLVGEASRLLSRLEVAQKRAEEIDELRSKLYGLRQRKSLSRDDAFVRRRLEEQLREAESERYRLLKRDSVDVFFSRSELELVGPLENGSTLLKFTKGGSATPHPRFFTLDPYTGIVLWGGDRDAKTIKSAYVLNVVSGFHAQPSCRTIPEPQMRCGEEDGKRGGGRGRAPSGGGGSRGGGGRVSLSLSVCLSLCLSLSFSLSSVIVSRHFFRSFCFLFCRSSCC